jgi:hypothetical protein
MHSAALAKEPLESLAAADVIALYPAGHMWIARRTNGRNFPRSVKFGSGISAVCFWGRHDLLALEQAREAMAS